MAELSLRQQIARNEYERNYKPQLDLLSGFAGEVKWNSPYAASARINCLNYADSIISLMLAKVDKALLTNWECYSKYFLEAKLEYMERVFAKQGNRNDIGGHTEEAAVSAGCTAIAKAQLQAIKSLLEGK